MVFVFSLIVIVLIAILMRSRGGTRSRRRRGIAIIIIVLSVRSSGRREIWRGVGRDGVRWPAMPAMHPSTRNGGCYILPVALSFMLVSAKGIARGSDEKGEHDVKNSKCKLHNF